MTINRHKEKSLVKSKSLAELYGIELTKGGKLKKGGKWVELHGDWSRYFSTHREIKLLIKVK